MKSLLSKKAGSPRAPAFFATPVMKAGENAAEACLRVLRCLENPLCAGTYCRGTEITRGWELTHVAAPR